MYEGFYSAITPVEISAQTRRDLMRKTWIVFVVLFVGCGIRGERPLFWPEKAPVIFNIDYTIHVVDMNGNPIPQALVQVSDEQLTQKNICEPTDCITNEAGIVTTKRILVGSRIRIQITKDGFPLKMSSWFLAPNLDQETTILLMKKPPTLRN